MGKPQPLLLAAAGCCAIGGTAFVAAPSAGAGAPAASLRGAAAATKAPAEVSGPSGTSTVLASGLLAVSAIVGRRQKHKTVRSAAEEGAKTEKIEVFNPAKEPGVTLPLMYFDPAGFAKMGDRAGFRNLRVSELKHGRVAMMAALGTVIQHNIKFPGFDEVPGGIKALITPPGTYGFIVLLAIAGGMELVVWKQDDDKEPGNFGDPLNFGMYQEEWRNRELNNGRMAMISILGIILAELVSGLDGVEQIWKPIGQLTVE
mmetsp:Transcript_29213/g.96970  ORF Transcript_29213/g.96970 Transcript_29213/m.96970 type:complete len:259 (-) Transcript_29213:89-865(-)